MKLQIGDRVHVKGHWNFPADCTGTIGAPPQFAQDLVKDSEPWKGHFRTVKGVKGPVEFAWVNFDTPQKDGDGDGPYSAGEIETRYIKRRNQPNQAL